MSKNLIEYFNGDELACNVWLSKYAMEGEVSPDDMHKRLAKEFARIEEKYQNATPGVEQTRSRNLVSILSNYGQNRESLTEESVYQLFKDFKYIVPQGSIMYGLGRGIPVSLSNCFVIDSAKDSYGGIMFTDQEQAQLMKRRGGVGHDLSLLRPKGTKVNNSAKSSTGMASFMHRFSNTTREVAQDGRRGALMLSIDINHPDVMDFIKIKRDGTSVTGANISIRLNDEFMKAVENDEDYILRFPCDLSGDISYPDPARLEYNKLLKLNSDDPKKEGYIKKVKAKEYWDEIIKSARNYAEPGLMFWDNVLDYDPAGVYDEFKPISSNPCGEQFLQAYDSCRLMAINLYSFVNNPFTDKAEIDYDKLYEVSYEQQRLADDLVDLEIEYIDRIIDKIKNDEEGNHIKEVEINLWKKIQDTAKRGRRTGCGITALGDMIAALGIGYDSDEALKITDKVMKTKMEAELDCNIDLAILRGSFEGWDWEKESGENANKFYTFIKDTFNFQYLRMIEYGRRSISWSTIAPTGSVSILTQTTSGCEPLFQPYYMRRKKINPNDEGARVDFVDESGDSWQEFPVLHEKFKDWCVSILPSKDVYFWGKDIMSLSKDDLDRAFKQSPWYKATANDIDWIKRVEMQSILQKYTTNAISSTINLPENVTEEEVHDIYINAWKKGLKGQTIYRDGSRSGVLVSENTNSKDIFAQTDAPKRPDKLNAESFITSVKGEKFFVIVGLLDNKPYEVFCSGGTGKVGKGFIIKEGQGEYVFKVAEDDYSRIVTKKMTDEQAGISRLISTGLRHGAPVHFVVEQLLKADGNFQSFNKAIARILKNYIPDGSKSTFTCDECGSQEIVFKEGCETCMGCGSSKCS